MSKIGRRQYTVLTAPQQVANAIRRDILEGVLAPGDKLLSEQTMSELFGVSRPTLRAGLQQLRAERVLEVKRGRYGGYEVSRSSLDTSAANVTAFMSLSLAVETLKPDQFLAVRLAQQLLCAESAALQRTPPMMKRLEAIEAQIEHASIEPRRAFELDLEFHRILAESTGNPLILSFEGAMIAVLHRLLGDGGSVSPTDSLGNVCEIIDAVCARDPERAREAMRIHLAHSAAHYQSA